MRRYYHMDRTNNSLRGPRGRPGPPGSGGASMSFKLSADDGEHEDVSNDDTVSILGGTGIRTTISNPDIITVELDDTLVTPGNYTAADITVDSQGRITNASNGGGGGGGGVTSVSMSDAESAGLNWTTDNPTTTPESYISSGVLSGSFGGTGLDSQTATDGQLMFADSVGEFGYSYGDIQSPLETLQISYVTGALDVDVMLPIVSAGVFEQSIDPGETLNSITVTDDLVTLDSIINFSLEHTLEVSSTVPVFISQRDDGVSFTLEGSWEEVGLIGENIKVNYTIVQFSA